MSVDDSSTPMTALREFYVCRDQLAEIEALLALRARPSRSRSQDDATSRTLSRTVNQALAPVMLSHNVGEMGEVIHMLPHATEIMYRKAYYVGAIELPVKIFEYKINRVSGRVSLRETSHTTEQLQ